MLFDLFGKSHMFDKNKELRHKRLREQESFRQKTSKKQRAKRRRWSSAPSPERRQARPLPPVGVFIDTKYGPKHNKGLSLKHGVTGVFDYPERVIGLADRALSWARSNPTDTKAGERAVAVFADSCGLATLEEVICKGATSKIYLEYFNSRVSPLLSRGEAAAVQAEHVDSRVWLDRDRTTLIDEHSMPAALLSAKMTIDAARKVLSGELSSAFVVSRPPGHHNGACELLERALGCGPKSSGLDSCAFACGGGCVLNETAIAVRNVCSGERPVRVCIVDLDVHFGDGTALNFYDDPNTLHVSLHVDQTEGGFFPFLKGKVQERGVGDGYGTTLNIPMLSGTTDRHAMRLLDFIAVPVIQKFKPVLLFVSMGLDALKGDPTRSGVNLTADFFRNAARRLVALCPKAVFTIQGGYQPAAVEAVSVDVVQSVLANTTSLMFAKPKIYKNDTKFEDHRRSIARIIAETDKCTKPCGCADVLAGVRPPARGSCPRCEGGPAWSLKYSFAYGLGS